MYILYISLYTAQYNTQLCSAVWLNVLPTAQQHIYSSSPVTYRSNYIYMHIFFPLTYSPTCLLHCQNLLPNPSRVGQSSKELPGYFFALVMLGSGKILHSWVNTLFIPWPGDTVAGVLEGQVGLGDGAGGVPQPGDTVAGVRGPGWVGGRGRRCTPARRHRGWGLRGQGWALWVNE